MLLGGQILQPPGSAAEGALAGCLPSLPDLSLQGCFPFVAWVLPSFPHILEDPAPVLPRTPSLEASQATAGLDGVCLRTELQDLSLLPLSPISLKHAPGQWILLFLLAHKLFLPLTCSPPFVAPEIKGCLS